MNELSKFKRAAAMGSSTSGSHHWLVQRYTAIALIILVTWLIFSISRVVGEDQATVIAFLKSPINAGLLIAFLIAGFYHAALGLQVVIEDYVHHKVVNIVSLTVVRLLSFVLCIIGTVSTLMIALA